MSPLSAPVLGGAALVSAPALWNALVLGTDSPTFALTRYLVSVLVCWLAFEVVGMLVGPVKPAAAEEAPAETEAAEQGASTP
jgi:hypothetical protein